MLFSSMVFLWVFLPLVFVVYRLLEPRFRNAFLLLASLAFYGWGDGGFLLLLLGSITLNYFVGRWLEQAEEARRKWLLAGAILLNLAFISYFKYANFFIDSINGLLPEPLVSLGAIGLPIGISFYTFQAISYDIDVYRREIRAQHSFVNMALYISCFPQLIAGPIVKYHDVEAQLTDRTLSVLQTAYGIRRFLYGLAKKVLIANAMGRVADEIFQLNPEGLSAPVAWFGAIAYALQIYFDFSGYSDMAIGLGKMFGFTFMENFNYPYISKSIQEFWRRWHISLSTWFKEYLYIPLGGSRVPPWRIYANLLIVFFATGLWHGASWNFVLWGLYHGVFLIGERMGLKGLLERPLLAFPARLYTLLAVLFGWVLFRADSLGYAWKYWGAMLRPGDCITLSTFANPLTLVPMAAGLLLCGPLQTLIPGLHARLFDETRVRGTESVLLIALFALSIVSIAGGSYNPFIYFRF